MTRTTAESFPEARNWSTKGSNKQEGFIVTGHIVTSTSLSTCLHKISGFFVHNLKHTIYIDIFLMKY